MEKGKQDFNGAIDGLGYKASMDDPKKPPLDLVPPTLARGIARVLGKGAKKYSRGNWMRGMSFSEQIAAAERHLLAIKEGEDRDPESGELHLYHLGCELAFLSWMMDGPRAAEYKRFDDRIFGLTAPETAPAQPSPEVKLCPPGTCSGCDGTKPELPPRRWVMLPDGEWCWADREGVCRCAERRGPRYNG